MKNLLIVWMVLSLAEVVRHWFIITKKQKSPDKLISYALRAYAATVLIFADALPLWVTIPTYAIVDWVIHDYVLNLLRGVDPIWYLNNTGPIDRFQRKYPNASVWFAWKLLAFIGLVGGYFFNF